MGSKDIIVEMKTKDIRPDYIKKPSMRGLILFKYLIWGLQKMYSKKCKIMVRECNKKNDWLI